MAKIIKYQLCVKVNRGTEENPQIEEVFYPVIMGWNEINEKTAKAEAYNGEYTIEDAELPEHMTPAKEDVSWDEMAEAIKEGVNEV